MLNTSLDALSQDDPDRKARLKDMLELASNSPPSDGKKVFWEIGLSQQVNKCHALGNAQCVADSSPQSQVDDTTLVKPDERSAESSAAGGDADEPRLAGPPGGIGREE